MTKIDSVLLDGFKRREAAWRRWGSVEPDVLAHLVNPAFMGGPRWPALRSSFRVVRNGRAVLLASDGLSDPFDGGEGPKGVSGLGLECFAISGDQIDTLPGSWLFDMVWQLSQFAAGRPGLAELLDELALLTIELYNVGIQDTSLARFVNPEGRVGVILGLQEAPLPSFIEGPLSIVRLVNAKLLTREEFAFVVEGGDQARHKLAERFPAPRLESSLSRESVV